MAARAPGGHWFRGTGSDHQLLALDRVTDTYPGPRAMAVEHEIMRLFDKMGVAEALLPSTAPFPAPDQFGVDGQLIRRIDIVQPPCPLGYVPAMVFTQPPMEWARGLSWCGCRASVGNRADLIRRIDMVQPPRPLGCVPSYGLHPAAYRTGTRAELVRLSGLSR